MGDRQAQSEEEDGHAGAQIRITTTTVCTAQRARSPRPIGVEGPPQWDVSNPVGIVPLGRATGTTGVPADPVAGPGGVCRAGPPGSRRTRWRLPGGMGPTPVDGAAGMGPTPLDGAAGVLTTPAGRRERVGRHPAGTRCHC